MSISNSLTLKNLNLFVNKSNKSAVEILCDIQKVDPALTQFVIF